MPTYALSLLGREARSRMAETLPTGLRLGHLAVLGALAEHSGQSQRSLADALAIHPTDLVAIVDDLLGRRLVSRDVDPEDRRRRRVQITAAGRRLVARATAASQRVLDDILTPLTPAERETVVRLLTAALRPLEG
jgi:MarR family transcriptional regulator, lower aerobic nicotinate degradation pathway regulator